MGKLIVLSLDESERNIYDKILEIVNEVDISKEKWMRIWVKYKLAN